jgi:hypothetical protein
MFATSGIAAAAILAAVSATVLGATGTASAEVPTALVGTWISNSDGNPAGPGGVSQYQFNGDGTYVLQMVNNNTGGGAALAGRYDVENGVLRATIDRCAPYACGPTIPKATTDAISMPVPNALTIGNVTYARRS